MSMYLLIAMLLTSPDLSHSLRSDGNIEAQFDNTFPANYQVGVAFINDYVMFCETRFNSSQSSIDPDKDIIDWIESRQDVTENFKKSLTKILLQARENNPEYGLGFDPILDAQDYPDKLELYSTDNNYLTVQGVNWSEFKLIILLKKESGNWLIDGAGMVNIPANRRGKR